MEWKDTVIDSRRIDEVIRSAERPDGKPMAMPDIDKAIAEAQAETSFGLGYEEGKNQQLLNAFGSGREAGIKEVVDFVESHIPKTLANYVGFWQNWQVQLKEWGLQQPLTGG